MNTFRRRIGKIKEYSGHDEATPQLRNRIINALKPVIKDSTGVVALDPYDDDIAMELTDIEAQLDKEYGVRNSDLFTLLGGGSAEDVFTAVELIIQMGHRSLHPVNFQYLVRELSEAFQLSGSVYELSHDGLVTLQLDEETVTSISDAVAILSEYDSAQEKIKNAATKLVSRENPSEVIRDAYLALEIYAKTVAQTSGKRAFEDAISKLVSTRPIQKEIISKLKGFKGNTRNISHDGNYDADEIDAVWFIRSVAVVVQFIESIKRQRKEAHE